MNDYRPLTSEEIEVLKSNDCWAEDWTSVNVSENFKPNFMHRVMLYGEVNIGGFDKNVEVSQGFVKHSGINNATLRNVTIGDDCLIENVGNFINNYTIGDDCYISNISTMETTEGATYGEGNLVSVLNEVGEGNVILFSDLNSQLAAFMVKHFSDKELKEKIRLLIKSDIDTKMPERGQIGNNVKIINTKEITNCVINDFCEVNGASRLSDCTLLGSIHGNVYIGTGVIAENSIIAEGSSVINSVKIQDCFIGETCQLSNGFTASASVFFANSYMSNGEACAAFCGPFTASHHKSSLLIGGMFSFYNAGSATNFSNHAYKMGPMHLPADASHIRNLLRMFRQTDAPSRHPQSAIRLSDSRWRQDVPHTRQKHHNRRSVSRHQEMAKARSPCSRKPQEHRQSRLAFPILSGRSSQRQENPRKSA